MLWMFSYVAFNVSFFMPFTHAKYAVNAGGSGKSGIHSSSLLNSCEQKHVAVECVPVRYAWAPITPLSTPVNNLPPAVFMYAVQIRHGNGHQENF